SLDAHPLQRRIQRSLFDRQHVRRQHLKVLRDAVAVHRLDRQRFQNQHLERARKQLVLALCLGFLHQPFALVNFMTRPACTWPSYTSTFLGSFSRAPWKKPNPKYSLKPCMMTTFFPFTV